MGTQVLTTLKTLYASYEELMEMHPDHNTMSVMGIDGDLKTIWDRNRPEEVEMAREQFRKMTEENRYRAFKVTAKGDAGEIADEFDPDEQHYIFVPPFTGG